MKKLIVVLLAFGPSLAFAQFGVNFHVSENSFFGVNYEIKNKIRPELRMLRIGNDKDKIYFEGVATYDIVEKENFEFYVGIGYRFYFRRDIVIPIGINMYPFVAKRIGFQLEVAPLIGDSKTIRASGGVRYRFGKVYCPAK